jgi:hypothetical protein
MVWKVYFDYISGTQSKQSIDKSIVTTGDKDSR